MGDKREDRSNQLQSAIGAVIRGPSTPRDYIDRSRHRSRASSNLGNMEQRIDDMVRASLDRVLARHENGIRGQTSSEVEAEILALKKANKELSLEGEVSKLKTPEAQSQYRVIGKMTRKIESALEKLDTISSSRGDSFHPLLSEIIADLASAHKLGSERCDLISMADENPLHGWSAMIEFERMHEVDSDPERTRLFAACIEKVENRDKILREGAQGF